MTTVRKIETNKCIFGFELYDDEAPIAAENFKKLAEKGYYDGVSFHRVIPNFMVQTEDPDSTGAGVRSYSIKCESIAKSKFTTVEQ